MFGGFGGLPRGPGQSDKPVLGAVQGVNPIRIVTPSTLGQVTEASTARQNITPRTLGAVTPPPSSAHVPILMRALPVAMNFVPADHLTLSILILTLSNRANLLSRLIKKLEAQISALGPITEVEVLIFEDNKEHSVGAKRNRLMDEAKGEFVVFIDDDDDIGDDYVYQFLQAIHDNPGLDCIGMRAVITTNGYNPRQVIYSVNNRTLHEAGGIYYRPPCHLTPIRRTIALGFRYPDKSFGEDSDVALRLISAGVLRKEYFLDKVQYHYQFSSTNSETQNRFKAPLVKGIFHIVILSARAENLRRCVTSILENEPTLPRERIIVVDDGSQGECGKEFPGIKWVKGIKPFIYARNANLGIREASHDVILLNDDTRLLTKFGFTSQSFATRAHPGIGMTSSAIHGFVGNPNQKTGIVAAGIRSEPSGLAFISVYLPKETLTKVGLLDERFVGYGYEDNDYCLRTRMAGFELAIYDGCVVEHGMIAGSSTFRSKPEISDLMEMNRQLYKAKWPDHA